MGANRHYDYFSCRGGGSSLTSEHYSFSGHPEVPEARHHIRFLCNFTGHPEMLAEGSQKINEMLKQVQHDKNFGSLCKVLHDKLVSEAHRKFLVPYCLSNLVSSKKAAFTLAEVLITLGIIGVVAAMTIPTLIANYQKLMTIVGLKKTYSLFSQAYGRSVAENGDVETWAWNTLSNVDNDFAELYILPYLKGVKKIEKEPDYTWKTLEGDFDDSGSYQNAKPQYVLPDGKLVTFVGYQFLNDPNPLNRPKTHLRINVDINGYKGPNRYGRDVFVFSIVPYPKSLKGQFVPGTYEQFTNGGFHFRLTREELTTSGSSTCKTDGTGRGYACANLIIMDGWQIKNDYPWK